MNNSHTFQILSTPSRQLLGRKILHTLVKQSQTPLEELVVVADHFGLRAIDVTEAIASRLELDERKSVKDTVYCRVD
jgi:hypothetical protein